MGTRMVSVVTGASRGIGRLLAERLARSGHSVHATMRDVLGRNRPNATALVQLAAREHLPIYVEEMDVTSDEQVARTIEGIVRDEGGVDILVNHAGAVFGTATEPFTPEEFHRLLDVNVLGAFRTSRAVLPVMRRQKSGLLIHVSAMGRPTRMPVAGAQASSKSALDAIGASLRSELASFGIDSLVVEPAADVEDAVTAILTLIETAPRTRALPRLKDVGPAKGSIVTAAAGPRPSPAAGAVERSS